MPLMGEEALVLAKQYTDEQLKHLYFRPESWEDVQHIVRAGLAPTVFAIGDQVSCYRATSVTASVSGSGITGANVDFNEFINAVGQSDPVAYVFTYDGAKWTHDSRDVSLTAYGISVTGTPAQDDEITVTVAATKLDWDIIGFDEDVFRAWRNGASVYYTCVDEPAVNELVFGLTGQTFVPVGYVSTGYDWATGSIGAVIGADPEAAFNRDSDSDTADGTHKHTMTLQLHDCFANVQFDGTEALYYCETALEPGTYYFTLLAGYDTEYGGGKSYQFELQQQVPEGGVLTFSWGYQVQASTVKVRSYASVTEASPIETVDVVEGTDGIKLTGCNHTHRIRYGSNNWANSAIRQFLNSAEVAGTYWQSKTKFDRPPSWAASQNGFMHGIDPSFASVLGTSCKVVNLNTVKTLDDAGKYVDEDDAGIVTVGSRQGVRIIKDKIFLPSYTEVYFGKQTIDDKGTSRSVSIGRPYSYYKRMAPAATTAALAERIKYLSGSARIWWVRSAVPSDAHTVYSVHTSGAYSITRAHNAHGCAPACNIM